MGKRNLLPPYQHNDLVYELSMDLLYEIKLICYNNCVSLYDDMFVKNNWFLRKGHDSIFVSRKTKQYLIDELLLIANDTLTLCIMSFSMLFDTFTQIKHIECFTQHFTAIDMIGKTFDKWNKLQKELINEVFHKNNPQFQSIIDDV